MNQDSEFECCDFCGKICLKEDLNFEGGDLYCNVCYENEDLCLQNSRNELE